VTQVYITIDTEYSAGMVARLGGDCRAENFRRSIACATPEGEVGVRYQLDTFDRFGLKAVFFVDPMPALLWGTGAIGDIVEPILARGHDVQLHLHTEWLALAGPANPLGRRTGRNIKDFPFDDQCLLIDHARAILVAAGAAPPVAFRAGNYGANDDTLRALAALGLAYDTSHVPAVSGSDCAISLGPVNRQPVSHCGVTEVPVGAIAAPGGGLRHAQLTALTSREMLAAMGHAGSAGIDSFSMVSHSFELLSRDRRRINRILVRRFERLCAGLAAMEGISTATYAQDPPRAAGAHGKQPVLPHSAMRTGLRVMEQAVANLLYGRR
jgi:hypothetical protein